MMDMIDTLSLLDIVYLIIAYVPWFFVFCCLCSFLVLESLWKIDMYGNGKLVEISTNLPLPGPANGKPCHYQGLVMAS